LSDKIIAAHNDPVTFKKLLTLLTVFCVLLAPIASSAGVIASLSATAHSVSVIDHDSHDDCNRLLLTDCHGEHDSTHSTAHHDSSKVSHSCCFSFIGMPSPTELIITTLTRGERIPFNPSLSLSARVEGLYRPPRQIS